MHLELSLVILIKGEIIFPWENWYYTYVPPGKRFNFDSSADISGEYDYSDAFKEEEAMPEKKQETAEYSRCSTCSRNC